MSFTIKAATIQIPKASMPTEIKYAVSFSMLNIQTERRAEGKCSRGC
jgi:hypothetical protein